MLPLKDMLFVTLMAVAVAGKSCPDYWTVHENSCYQFFEEEEYNAAQSRCETMNGYIVSINTHDENEFIAWLTADQHATNVGHKTWIGLGNDYHDQETKHWDDGSTMVYENFALNEPDDQDGHEDCVEINEGGRGKWNDNTCTATRRYVCESTDPATRSVSRSRRSRANKRGRCEL